MVHPVREAVLVPQLALSPTHHNRTNNILFGPGLLSTLGEIICSPNYMRARRSVPQGITTGSSASSSIPCFRWDTCDA